GFFLYKTTISSCIFNGWIFASNAVELFFLFHTHVYLKFLILLFINFVVKGCDAVKTIAPLSFITLSYCSQNGSKGIIVSHLHAVVPYGKSHKTISTDLSGIFFIPTKQSSLYILFSSISIYSILILNI